MFVGIGIPIPVLDEDMAARLMIRNDQITTRILDYGNPDHPELGRVTYAQLMSGRLILMEKRSGPRLFQACTKRGRLQIF